MRRVVGSPTIQFVFQYKKQVVEQIVSELGAKESIKEVETIKFDGTFKLESTPSVIPKNVFCGRDEILKQIKVTTTTKFYKHLQT